MKIKKWRQRMAGLCLLLFLLCFWGCGLADRVEETFYDGLGNAVVGKAEEAEAVSTDRYAYGTLSTEEQKVYDQIVAAIKEQKEKVVVSTKEEAVLEQAFSGVLADYGEFFWISGYEYNTYTSGDRVIGLEVLPTYTMEPEKRKSLESQVEEVANQWLENLPENADDYVKSKFVFETLIGQVDYVEDAKDSQNILSVFLHRQTVCQGYAEAVVYLLHKLGVQAAVVTGQADNQPHAWNLVRLNGEYYYMDVTWGNGTYDTREDEIIHRTNYFYLNMTTEDLLKTHRPETTISLPACTAVADSYYHREGVYFDRWDELAIGSVFQQAWDQKKEVATVRLANEQLYRQAVEYFIEDQHLKKYCRGIKRIRYLEQPEEGILTLQF